MKILFYIKLYVLTIPIFFMIDVLWIGVIAKRFYQSRLEYILAPHVNWTAAVSFYLIYIAGIILFAVRPAISANSLTQAAGFGALFGFFTYATYDLTNLATLRGWPIAVTIVDIIWGVCLCTLVAVLSFLVSKWLNP